MKSKVIGLTGQTGAGKSTVSAMAESYGCHIINADKVAREATAKNSECLKRLAEFFGNDIIDSNGECVRKLLAQRAFSSRENTDMLNSITHPMIIRRISEYIGMYGEDETVIIDAPQLFESGGDNLCSVIIAVTAPKEVRLNRITERDGITREQALMRMNVQKDEYFYTERADYVIDGGKPMKDVEAAAEAVLEKIRDGAGGKGERMSRKKKKNKSLSVRILTVFGILFLIAVLSVAFALLIRGGNEKYTYSSYPLKYCDQVEQAAKKYCVSKYLIYAVIKTESNFDPDAESSAGAIGLMQIMPVSFNWIQENHLDDHDPSATFEDLKDPALNIDYGTHMLSLLIEMYGNEETAICAYNGGLGNVNRWLEDENFSSDGKTLKLVPYKETADYRSKVMRYESIYKKLYGENDEELYLVYPQKYRSLVEAASEKYGVDKYLIYGVIKTESNFDPDAESPVGALGLMQIMPVSFEWLQQMYGDEHEKYSSFEDMRNPEANIDFGTHMLKILIDMYGNEETAVCAYNGGIGNVNQWLEDENYSSDGKTLDVVPYEETSNYRERVIGSRDIYRELYSNPEDETKKSE